MNQSFKRVLSATDEKKTIITEKSISIACWIRSDFKLLKDNKFVCQKVEDEADALQASAGLSTWYPVKFSRQSDCHRECKDVFIIKYNAIHVKFDTYILHYDKFICIILSLH